MSNSVVVSPQYSNVRVCLPWQGFQSTYNGQSGLRPIMWSEDGVAASPVAANTVAGVSVPLGARVVIWIPRIKPVTTTSSYVWFVMWRLTRRDVAAQAESSSHLVQDKYNELPAAVHSVVYNSAAPALDEPAVQTVTPEYFELNPGRYEGGGLVPQFPFMPDGSDGGFGYGQSGQRAYWEIIELAAQGDQLLLGCYKKSVAASNWAINGGGGDDGELFDAAVSKLYPVYVAYGSSQ